MERLAELIDDGKQKEAFHLTKQLRDWMAAVKGIAGQRQQSREEAPETKAAREALEKVERTQTNIFKGQVASVVIKGMNSAITRSLEPQVKALKLKLAQKAALINRVRTRLASVFERDDRYQDRMAQLLEAGELRPIERFLRGRLDRSMVRKAVKRELALGNFRIKTGGAGGEGGGKGTGAGATGGNASAIKVAKKPTPDQIDWSQDKSRARFQAGEATLKGSKKIVRWDWNEQ